MKELIRKHRSTLRHKRFIWERKFHCWRGYRTLSRNRKRLIRIAWVLLIMTVTQIAILCVFPVQSSTASWFDSNWAFRQKIALATHTASENNVYIPLSIDTAALVTAGKLQSDCGDLRFTDVGGALLEYYIVSGCNSASTSIHVNFTTYPAGVQVIYQYYGNASAPNGFAAADFTTLASNSSTTLNLQISANNNDAYQVDGSTTVNISPAASGFLFGTGTAANTPDEHDGLRFTGGPPQGAKIIDATVQLRSDGANWTQVNWHFFGEAADNCSSYTNGTGDQIANRVKTTASTAVNENISRADLEWVSYDTTSIVQEVVSRGGFAGPICIIAAGDGASNFAREDFRDYGNGAANAAKLDITYESLSVAQGSEEKGPGPVLYWNFNEGYGTTAHDYTGSGNNGTFGASTAAPTIQTEDNCYIGKCLKFDGSNDYVSKTYSSDKDLDPATANLTVAAWFRHPNAIAAQENIISRFSSGGYRLYMQSNGTICFGIDNDGTGFPSDSTCSTTAYNDSAWHHVEAVKNGTTSITLYIDGMVVGTPDTSITASSISGSSPAFVVGADSNTTSNPWNGFIDEVKVINDQTARTAAQVKADFVSKNTAQGAGSTLGAKDKNSVPSQGLVGYWNLDENTGTAAADSSGNNLQGTFTNTPTWTSTGKFGSATTFSNSTNYISIGDQPALELQTMTISAWVYRTGACGTFHICVIFSKGSSGLIGYRFQVHDPSGTYVPELMLNDTQEVTGTTVINTNTWYHLVATMDGKTVRLYVNGKLDSETVQTQTPAYGTESAKIGNGNTSNDLPFEGKIDEVRAYNRVLPPSEVSQLYESAPRPAGYWNFDEHTGTTANDSSGNGITGTLSGGPVWGPGKYGSGLSFDGSNDNVNMGDQFDFTGNTPFSVGSWVKLNAAPSAGTFAMIASKYDTGTAGQWWLAVDELRNVSFLRECGSFGTSSVTALSLNTWYYISASYDGSTLRIYINSALDQQTTDSCSIANQSVDLVVGAGDNGGGVDSVMNGSLDDVRVYDYARTAKQVVSDMNAGHPNVGSPVASAIGHWKFDEGYSTTAHNAGSCSSTCNGTLTNMATGSTTSGWTNAGKLQKAVGFDGNNDYVTMGNPTAAQITSDLSLSAWVRLGQTNLNQDIIAKRGAAGQWGYRLWVDNAGTPKFDLSQDGSRMATVSASTTLAADTWYHLTGTFATGSAMTVYVNGIQKGQTIASLPTGVKNSTANLNIGAENAGTSNFLRGAIDETKVYNYALSADEVKTEFNQGKSQTLGALSTNADGVTASNSAARAYCPPGDSSGNCATGSDPSPVQEWKFDERTGIATVNDTAGGLSGTMQGPFASTAWVPGKIGSALNFDGIDDRISIPGNVAQGLSQMTVEFWFNPGLLNSTAQEIINERITGSNVRYKVAIDTTNKLIFSGRAPDTDSLTPWVVSTKVLSTNTWYHVTAVFDSVSDVHHLYINGIDESASVSEPAFDNTNTGNNDLIGTLGTGNEQFAGKLDQVTIYNYARTPAQVAWDYNKGKPVGWWKFDECTGSTAHDAMGNGLNGTITIGGTGSNTSVGNCNSGTTTEAWNNGTTGKFNAGLDFDGVNDYVSVADNNALDITGDFTLSAWINRDFDFTGQIISKTNGGTSGGYSLLAGTNGEVYCRTNNGTASADSYTSQNLVMTGTGWHHVAAIRTGTSCRIFVDGIDRTATTATHTTLTANALALTLGARPDFTEPFDGKIDDARVYNYALTTAQIKTLYNQGQAVQFGPASGMP